MKVKVGSTWTPMLALPHHWWPPKMVPQQSFTSLPNHYTHYKPLNNLWYPYIQTNNKHMKWTHWVNDLPKSIEAWSTSKSTNTACFDKGKISMKNKLYNFEGCVEYCFNRSLKLQYIQENKFRCMYCEDYEIWAIMTQNTYRFYILVQIQDYTYMMWESRRAKKLRGTSISTNQFCIITLYYFREMTLDSTTYRYLPNFVPPISLHSLISSPSHSILP